MVLYPFGLSNDISRRNRSNPQLVRRKDQHALVFDQSTSKFKLIHCPGTTPPSVHQMALALERRGLLRRTPGEARSLEVLVLSEELPILR